MFSAEFAGQAAGLLARLDTVLDELCALDLSAGSDEELIDVLAGVERRVRRFAVVDHVLLAETDARGVGLQRGCSNTTAFLTRLLRVGVGQARSRVRAARQLAPRRTLTGQVLAPEFPATAAAQAEGAISAEHARVITGTVKALPAEVREEKFEEIEAELADHARQFSLDQFRLLARHLGDVLDPDGTLRDAKYRERQRGLNFRQRPDGSVSGSFEGSAEFGEALQSLLDKSAAPRPAADGAKDPRTPEQRRHDGLLEAMKMLLRSGRLILDDDPPTTGPPGGARAVRDLFAKTRPVAAYGTTHRIFTEGQRLAMIARDKGCSFPGCTIGPAWCQAHHVTQWQLGRRTSIHDAALLCGFHHREFENLGWDCDMINAIPHYRPPHWLDGERTPQRNSAHDVPAA